MSNQALLEKLDLKLVLVAAISTMAGAALLASLQFIGLQIPGALVGWLATLFRLDGESAYDAGYFAFFLEVNAIGMAVYLIGRRA